MTTGVRIALGFAIMGVAFALATTRARYLVELLLRGRRDPERFKYATNPSNVKYHAAKVLGQKKLLQWEGPGSLHAATFWGFLVVQVMLIESIGELFTPNFAIPGPFRWGWWGALGDTFLCAVALALIGFVIIRIKDAPKREGRRSRFFGSHLFAAYMVLLMIFGVISSVAIVRGARWALHTLPYPDAYLSHGIGKLFVNAGYSHSTLRWIEDGALLIHLAIVFSFLIFVLNSKHMHIFTSPINVVFGRQPLALGPLRPIEIDMENVTEDTVFGVGKVEDFTWKQLLDGYTCTECGRCQSVCPAWNTGKTLNPKFIITQTRDHLFQKAPYLLGEKVWDMNAPGSDDPESPMNRKLVGDVHLPESIWACVTCGACVYECPVDIEHVDHIVDMRRAQVMMESEFPQEAGLMLRNLENSGNPWGEAAQKRLDWTKGLEEHIVVVNGRIPADAEYLYWVGCAGAFDDRAKKAVRAFAELMVEAGVAFAILGPQESCTGDPARRIGNEYLFQEMAKQNIAMLKEKGVRKIVASCPHCFNSIAREYPQFGGTFEVIHHTDLLARLIADGKLKPTENVDKKVSYHDPCYLARHNDVIEQPRQVLDAVPGLTTHDPHNCKRRTFCCGAGGSRLWMEETVGTRINAERFDQMIANDPDIVSVACPYCMIMLDDAAKDAVQKGKASEDLRVLDVAQLLRQSVNGAPKVTIGAAPPAAVSTPGDQHQPGEPGA
ncbi:MAG TPA: (Fe-S)-binding protein [Actinomycetota bacterium]|nr:(Fe-S)-binding protein [Actinomycetota bacterium]